MGRDLVAEAPAARALFARADAQLGFPLSDLCFTGPEESLTDTVNQQPALYVTSLAAWSLIEASDEWPTADYVAGHSLGELSALAAAGSLSFADGLALVRRRGELMKMAGEQAPGAMAALLGLELAEVEAICAAASATAGRPVQLANDNCPGQIVISGDPTALDLALAAAEAAGARKAVRLPITIAAHSPLMSPAQTEFAAAIAATPIAAPRVPVIGNVLGAPLTTPEAIRAELEAQLTAPVRWTDSMRYLLDQGVATFAEVGPGTVLTGLMKRIDRQATRLTFTV